VLIVGYGQLVTSLSGEIDPIYTCANGYGVSYFCPGKSCRDIYDHSRASHGKSGYYMINPSLPYQVYCDMELTCGGITGGWMRIANIDTSQGDYCPSGWNKTTQPKPLCRGSSDSAGCYSAYFTNNKFEYNFICGKLRGYQKGTNDAFAAFRTGSRSIDGPYLDGVSITVGSPRKHVWSYGVGVSQLHNAVPYNCPCAKFPGANPPAYVRDHYYCESGSRSHGVHATLYGSDPLWDGHGCPAGDDCCSTLGAPWFYRQFTEPEKGAVEVRICQDEPYANEATLLEQVQLYIQ